MMPRVSSSVGRLLLASVAGFGAGLLMCIPYGALVSLLPAAGGHAGFVMIGGCAVFFGTAAVVATVVMDGGRPRLNDPPVGPPEQPFVALDDAALAAIAEARAPAVTRNEWPIFVVSCATFIYIFGRGNTAVSVGLTLAALILHEAGHLLAMRALGYSDSRIFLVPLVGSLLSGKKATASWHECFVLLMGPLPGIVLAIALLAFAHPLPSSRVAAAARILIALNVVQLFPLTGFDGGRLMNRLVFSRHPVLETFAMMVMASGAVALGYHFHWYGVLGLGIAGLLLVRAGHWLASSAAAVRDRWPVVPLELTAGQDEYLAALYATTAHLRQRRAPATAALAGWMRAVHGRVVAGPVAIGPTAVFLVAYGGVCIVGLAGLVMLARMGR